MNTAAREFTMRDALNIQKEQLDRWKKVLNAEAYTDLVTEAEAKNKETTNPNYVFRGSEMDNFIANWSR